MFFLLRDLPTINHMYRFSLPAFLALFKRALQKESPPGNVTARLSLLSEALVDLVFEQVSRSLFNTDRLTFAMHLTRYLQPQMFGGVEWDFFLGKAGAAAGSTTSKPAWVREELAVGFTALCAALPDLAAQCDFMDADTWAAWATATDGGSEGSTLPPRVNGQLSAFQQLLVIKALKPDRLQSAMTDFVCRSLKLGSVVPTASSLAQVCWAFNNNSSKSFESLLCLSS